MTAPALKKPRNFDVPDEGQENDVLSSLREMQKVIISYIDAALHEFKSNAEIALRNLRQDLRKLEDEFMKDMISPAKRGTYSRGGIYYLCGGEQAVGRILDQTADVCVSLLNQVKVDIGNISAEDI